ncbi:MAG: malto-oligosyltrehalose synthase [Methylobacteriaceae bacterium]|nr:malto-oligosyltrehalose synthase [Methylobacteriaceae bacterium]
MSAGADAVDRLANLLGIAPGYTDVHQNENLTPQETKRAIIGAFGLDVSNASATRDSLASIEQMRRALVAPVITPDTYGTIPVRAAPETKVEWQVALEDGGTREGRARVEHHDRGTVLWLDHLPGGYHKLITRAGDSHAESLLIIAPQRCYQPEQLERGRAWGLTCQVASLRGSDDIGIGNLTNVAELATAAGRHGASFLGLSPLHALFASDRSKISPYSPSSRLFLDPLLIDLCRIPEFAGSRAAKLLEGESAAQIDHLRRAPFVDHAAVWAIQRRVLDALWQEVRSRGATAEFEAFRRDEGDNLRLHAIFESASEKLRQDGCTWLGEWPEAFRDHASPQVARFAQQNSDLVDFHEWLQFLADRQLAEAARDAASAGMEIGLYRDLAVGGDSGGSEVWAHPDRFAPALSIGAPPDLLGPEGQNWGLPPFHPLALEAQGFAAFRALVRANMRHAGAIRIDHAFQLQRLFLIPRGQSAKDGAYVEYPFEASLAVLRLESHRNRCLVIAEDLGTAPEGFSDAIMRAGLLSYRILFFEHDNDGAFKPPDAYPRDALAALTTHDLPTFMGWWRGQDVDLRETFGIFAPDLAARERALREADKVRLRQALEQQNLTSADDPGEPPLVGSIRYLGRTPSILAAVQVEDATREMNQANMPGPDRGHPNWKRRLRLTLREIAAPGGPLAKTAAALALEGRGLRPEVSRLASPPPRATYRLQFHKAFGFDQASAILPYLAKLGISHVYASPIFQARPGSTHGYDSVDPTRINPELGGEAAFLRFSDTLAKHDLQLVLDIVPNHMGVGGADNPWWLSILEWGELSPHAHYFDVDWQRLGAHGKLVLPFLGEQYGEALESGNLHLAFDAAQGAFSVWQYEHRFPISPLTYPDILDNALAILGTSAISRDVLAIVGDLRSMASETSARRRADFPVRAEGIKKRLARAARRDPALLRAIERAVEVLNGIKGRRESFEPLHELLEQQAYRLAYWRVAASDVNYRRFFDIDSLAGLRVEERDVFEASHALIFRLVREGRVHGLRVDHIDGLADPAAYVEALQGAVGPGFYIVVEKILEPGERLREWPIAGTTGYDALTLLDGILVDRNAKGPFDRLYRVCTGRGEDFHEALRRAKLEILETSFASELEGLVSDAKRIADSDRRTRDATVNAIRTALSEIIAAFPVYRTYLTERHAAAAEDVEIIETSVAEAKAKSRLADPTVHDMIAGVLLERGTTPARPSRSLVSRLRRRFQQLTGPVMAKSLEDTLFYREVRFLVLNEVGGDPAAFGIDLNAFYAAQQERYEHQKNALIATATHDTKRGEDARGRLLALSEMPENWARLIETVERAVLERFTDREVIDPNDRYMLLQSFIGAMPLEAIQDTSAPEIIESFRERLNAYVQKALREAKRHTSWINPNESYEASAREFIALLLDPAGAPWAAIVPLAQELSARGMLNGLTRTILKSTLPGVPDFYQGTEFWDFSLVDPDNRRPVDYSARAAALSDSTDLADLIRGWADGRIKQRVMAILLADRAAAPELYSEGTFEPLAVRGAEAARLVAFKRQRQNDMLMVAVPRLLHRQLAELDFPLGEAGWRDTRLGLPEGRWRNLLTGSAFISNGEVTASELLSDLPFAVARIGA